MNTDIIKPFTIVYDWMIDKDYLGLDCTSAMVFAIIYSFTNSKAGCYYGNRDYIAKKIGKSTRTVTTIVNTLVTKELVIKTVRVEGCIKHNTLTANVDLVEEMLEDAQHSRGKKLPPTAEKTSLVTAEKTSLNNKVTNNKEKNNIYTNTNVLVEHSSDSNLNNSNNPTLTNTVTTTDTNCLDTVCLVNEDNVLAADTDKEQLDLGLINNRGVQGTVSKKKKKSRYDKCAEYINEFTADDKLRGYLFSYLDMILEKSKCEGRPMYANQFKHKLNVLKDTVPQEDWVESVMNATSKGWNGFYPVKHGYQTGGYAGKTKSKVFSEVEGATCNFETSEDIRKREEFLEEMKRSGKQIAF